MANPRDPYEVLGVERSATRKKISAAYRQAARQHHPDVDKSEGAEDRFKEVQAAYDVLKDADKRQRYDQYGWRGLQSRPGAGFGSVDIPGFGDLFDVFFRRSGGAGGPQRGRDLQQPIELEFLQAIHGVATTISVARHEVCDDCHGSGIDPGSATVTCTDCGGRGEVRTASRSIFGQFVNITNCRRCGGSGQTAESPCSICEASGQVERSRRLEVNIPGGVDNGTEIRLTGQGDTGVAGGPPGDLYLVVSVAEHPSIVRHGRNLQSEAPISVTEAVLGVDIEIDTVDGLEVVSFGPGTQPGQSVRLAGRGAPGTRDRRRGDHFVVARVEIPQKLTAEQRQLFEQLAALEGERPAGIGERLREIFS